MIQVVGLLADRRDADGMMRPRWSGTVGAGSGLADSRLVVSLENGGDC